MKKEVVSTENIIRLSFGFLKKGMGTKGLYPPAPCFAKKRRRKFCAALTIQIVGRSGPREGKGRIYIRVARERIEIPAARKGERR